jgi:mannose/cellobiose epimerase-like protein (N-acyl-D-glucosamine 2-epimerase family)
MNALDFSFSDLIAGYVTKYDSATDKLTLKTSDGREYIIGITPTTYAEIIRNLGEGFKNASDNMRSMFNTGRFLFAYGVFYPDSASKIEFDAKHIVFAGRSESSYEFEKPDWWLKQIDQLGQFYINSQFGDGPIDYANYRTNLSSSGAHIQNGRQETDTISRLVYGFATAYMVTGKDVYLEAANKGTAYLRDHLRFVDTAEDVVYWYHAVDKKANGSLHKVFASEFGDDFDALPCYEQIYALAGPVQTYRITGDKAIYEDTRRTINLFNRFYKDHSPAGGYYSHIDPITLDAHTESLGRNRARKNWNSVGDHAPAYLINLWLATGEKAHADFLEYTFDTISKHFPDYESSPFVQEKFFHDWSKDQSWGWQQNRAVVGHNLKISWNLMRMNSLTPKKEYVELAEKIAVTMPEHGADRQRGGWYDVVERVTQPGEKFHRYAWHNRKAWWQQEQGILAYLILSGVLGKEEYLRYAREGSAFYNAWFLDVEQGGIYFNVMADGNPYALGTERAKGSHSMSGYHSFELCYLAAVYTNLLVNKEPMDFYFRPVPSGFADGTLRVQPDILPVGSIRIDRVWIDGNDYADFDAHNMSVNLPKDHGDIKVRVRIVPNSVRFDAELLSVSGGVAKVAFSGTLTSQDLKYLDEAVNLAFAQGANSIDICASKLEGICSEGLRYLVFRKQKAGENFSLAIKNANATVRAQIDDSTFSDSITLS